VSRLPTPRPGAKKHNEAPSWFRAFSFVAASNRCAMAIARSAQTAGTGWLHEIKHDGFRMLVRRDAASVRLFTRNGHDWTDRFPLIARVALSLKAARDRNAFPSATPPPGRPGPPETRICSRRRWRGRRPGENGRYRSRSQSQKCRRKALTNGSILGLKSEGSRTM